MDPYISVPPERLEVATLQALLEEYASRDGTDYGEVELTLEQKTGNLRRQLAAGELCILYHAGTEQWDLVDVRRAREMLQEESV